MKLYLAGPMTGYENLNFPEFFRIAPKLREQGHEVVSPAEFDIQNGWALAEFKLIDDSWATCTSSRNSGPDHFQICSASEFPHRYTTTGTATYDEMLERDCELVRECDGIVLMRGWESSNGATRELQTALDTGLEVYLWDNVDDRLLGVHPATACRLLREALSEHPDKGYESRTDETMPHEGVPNWRTESYSYMDNPQPDKPATRSLRTPEQHEVVGCFIDLLLAATGDGGKKRAAGTKPSWKVDASHEGAIFSHICKWKRGEKVDPDSGVHPLAHAAWRCLAIAAQESAANGLIPEAPSGASLDYPEVP